MFSEAPKLINQFTYSARAAPPESTTCTPKLQFWVTKTALPAPSRFFITMGSGVSLFSALSVEMTATDGAQAAMSPGPQASLSAWLGTLRTAQRRSAPEASRRASSACSMSPASSTRPSGDSSIITRELSSSFSGNSTSGAST